MLEDFSALNRALNINGPNVIKVSYNNCIPYVNLLEIQRRKKEKREKLLYESVKRRRLMLAIEKYEIKDYIKKPKLDIVNTVNTVEIKDYIKKPKLDIVDTVKPVRIINHIPKSRCDFDADHKKKNTTKDRPVKNITREDLGCMKPGLIDKVNQTKFIF